jgi:HEAT repeat protein
MPKFELFRQHSAADIRRMEQAGDAGGLVEALDAPRVSGSVQLRTAVVTALRRAGLSQTVPVVSDLLLTDPAEPVRRAAANALGEFGDPAALPALRDALDDNSETVRLWAIKSLGRLRDRESVDRLIGLLDSPDSGFRSYAAQALGDIGDQRGTEPLLAHLDDPSGTVQIAVCLALRRLGDPRAIPALQESQSRANWRRRRRLTAALADLEERFGASGGPQSGPPSR